MFSIKCWLGPSSFSSKKIRLNSRTESGTSNCKCSKQKANISKQTLNFGRTPKPNLLNRNPCSFRQLWLFSHKASFAEKYDMDTVQLNVYKWHHRYHSCTKTSVVLSHLLYNGEHRTRHYGTCASIVRNASLGITTRKRCFGKNNVLIGWWIMCSLPVKVVFEVGGPRVERSL